MYYTDGSVYEGEWYNDKKNGQGMLRLRKIHFYFMNGYGYKSYGYKKQECYCNITAKFQIEIK